MNLNVKKLLNKAGKKSKRFKIVTGILVVLVILFAVCMRVYYISNNSLVVTTYEVSSSKINSEITIVHLTDLHDYQFGEENSELVSLIEEQNPNFIVITGDMVNRDSYDMYYIKTLISKLSGIAGVYYSLGNTEVEYMQENGINYENWKNNIESAGAVVLENEYNDVIVGENKIRIGGADYYIVKQKSGDADEMEYMEDFIDTDNFKLLLAHHPEGFLMWHSFTNYDVDLVVSGHIEGGEIRLPFIGGLYAPEEGLFPKFTDGLFQYDDATEEVSRVSDDVKASDTDKNALVLSRGLGSSRKLRFNNTPELVVIKVKPAQ